MPYKTRVLPSTLCQNAVQFGHAAGSEVYLIAEHECGTAMKRMFVDCLSCLSYLNANNGTPCMYGFSAQCSSWVYLDLRRVTYALWNLQHQGGYVSQQISLNLHLR